ncbi:MAG: hypothetical protein P1V97_11175 [Planctomycetota bacterium]|nr:hypothetical protein [Planctomycetota bacterium]
MNPDQEQRLRERSALVARDPWAQELFERRAQRFDAEDPVFELRQELKLPRHIVPPFSLKRGEVIGLHLNIYDWERFFIPALRRLTNPDLDFIYLDHYRAHFLTRSAESREIWLARALQTKKRRARRRLKQNDLDPLAPAGTERLAELAVALNWAREKSDAIMLDLARWNSVDPEELHNLLRNHRGSFAWILTPECSDVAHGLSPNRSILTQSTAEDSLYLN